MVGQQYVTCSKWRSTNTTVKEHTADQKQWNPYHLNPHSDNPTAFGMHSNRNYKKFLYHHFCIFVTNYVNYHTMLFRFSMKPFSRHLLDSRCISLDLFNSQKYQCH